MAEVNDKMTLFCPRFQCWISISPAYFAFTCLSNLFFLLCNNDSKNLVLHTILYERIFGHYNIDKC